MVAKLFTGWGDWCRSPYGLHISRDRFTEKRHWSIWFFADWRLGVVVHGFKASLLVLPQRPLVELQIGWPEFDRNWGSFEVHLGWVHAQTHRVPTPKQWAEWEIKWAQEDADLIAGSIDEVAAG